MNTGGPWDVVIKILAGACLAGGIAWGGYLQAQIDASHTTSATLLARSYNNAERISVVEANYATIKESLSRIERKLEAQSR